MTVMKTMVKRRSRTATGTSSTLSAASSEGRTLRKKSQRQCRAVAAAAMVATGGTEEDVLEVDGHADASGAEPLGPEESFLRQWWPVAVTDFLDASRPHAFTLMGQDLVLWRDGSGEWRAFDDACPHRLAPLSEGRVEEDGTLLCSYHGWRFDGDSNCTTIPQAEKEKEASLCSSPRACATSYPTMTEGGVLYVFGVPGADGLLMSVNKKPRRVPEANNEGAVLFPYSFRDLPYGWEAFVENVTDGSHVPVSHHNVIGNRYTDPGPIATMANVHRPLSDEEGFHIGGHNFKPPSLMTLALSKSGKVEPDETNVLLELNVVPTKPGWCRLIGRNIILPKPGKSGKDGKGFGIFTALTNPPAWLLHVSASFFLHQDMVLLHHQEKLLAKRGGDYLSSTYIPTMADRATVAFRRWLRRNGAMDSHGQYAVPWELASGTEPSLPPRQLDLEVGGKERLFDVYNTHTKNCTACMGALKNVRRLRNIAVGLASVCAVHAISLAVVMHASAITAATAATAASSIGIGGTAVASTAASLSFSLGGLWTALTSPLSVSVIAAIALAATALALEKLRGLFYYHPFDHQSNA